tara:strand:- start:150 stop:350 length:201 start_codon:yes stop_codon:yes gene_type:complete
MKKFLYAKFEYYKTMDWNSDQKALIQWITSGLKIKEVRDLKGDSGYLLNNMIAKVTLAISNRYTSK